MTRVVGDFLARLLPAAGETALLEACLHRGARAQEGWSRWCAGRPAGAEATCRALAASRTLMPLLARSAARHRLDLEPEVLSYVRAAALREQLRAERFRGIAAEVIARLDRAAVPVFVVRGTALAATAYGSWSLRHCHDLDLLLEPRRLADAAAALAQPGFAAPAPAPRRDDGTTLRHASGLRIALHAQPFAVRHYAVPATVFAGAGCGVAIDGRPARMPAPEATLVHVLGHATYSPSRRTLRWVTDVWHLVAYWPDLDWTDVVRRLDAYRLALPVSALLTYVAGLGVAVPPEVLAHLRAGAAAAGAIDEDVALGGALAAAGGDAAALWRSASWPARLRLARWAVAPSAAYMRGEFGVSRGWWLPLCYAYRPARFVGRTLGWRTARPAPDADAVRASPAH